MGLAYHARVTLSEKKLEYVRATKDSWPKSEEAWKAYIDEARRIGLWSMKTVRGDIRRTLEKLFDQVRYN